MMKQQLTYFISGYRFVNRYWQLLIISLLFILFSYLSKLLNIPSYIVIFIFLFQFGWVVGRYEVMHTILETHTFSYRHTWAMICAYFKRTWWWYLAGWILLILSGLFILFSYVKSGALRDGIELKLIGEAERKQYLEQKFEQLFAQPESWREIVPTLGNSVIDTIVWNGGGFLFTLLFMTTTIMITVFKSFLIPAIGQSKAFLIQHRHFVGYLFLFWLSKVVVIGYLFPTLLGIEFNFDTIIDQDRIRYTHIISIVDEYLVLMFQATLFLYMLKHVERKAAKAETEKLTPTLALN